MSLTSGFFDAMEQGEGNYDRVYTAAEFAHYFSLLVGNGVFPSPDTGLNVLASDPASMTVKIGDGSGWINGYFVTVSGGHSVTLEAASGAGTRIDSIIMQWNSNDRKINIISKSGTASGDPQPVDLQRDAELWELELAQITVGAGVSSVDQTKIKDMRSDETRCGLVTALLKGIDPSTFLKQSEAEFNQWFETVMNKISSEDVAGSLLKMITEVDNREKEHYTELSGKVNESLDKASMLRPKNTESYKNVISAVRYIESVSPISFSSNYSVQSFLCHTKSQRIFTLTTYSNENKVVIYVDYKNQVTGKWVSSVLDSIDTSYYAWYRLIATNGEYLIVQNNYAQANILTVYKGTVNENGTLTFTTAHTITVSGTGRGEDLLMGQPLEGLPQSLKRFMLLSSKGRKYIVDVESGSIESFTTPKTYSAASWFNSTLGAKSGITTSILSDGSVIAMYAGGFGIITQDKNEHLFSIPMTGQACLDKSGKYIYVPTSSKVTVISTDTYEIVKTISSASPSSEGIYRYDDTFYNIYLQEFTDETFQKVLPIVAIGTEKLYFGGISSNYTNILSPLGLKKPQTSVNDYTGMTGNLINEIALPQASPVIYKPQTPCIGSSKSRVKTLIALEE